MISSETQIYIGVVWSIYIYDRLGYLIRGFNYRIYRFKVKRGGEYQAIDSNNPFQEGDELEYFSPTINNDDDKNLRSTLV